MGNLSDRPGPAAVMAVRENWRGTLPETNLPNHGQPRAG
jgi:hypothetical protein